MAKCCTKNDLCSDKLEPICESIPFLNTPAFWHACLVINVFLVILRLIYLQPLPIGPGESKYFNKALLYFLLWLELQYWSFILLILFSNSVYLKLKSWFKIILFYVEGIFGTRITNYIMLWLTLIKTDLFFWQVWCLMFILVYSILSFIVFSLYVCIVVFLFTILLGYTHF